MRRRPFLILLVVAALLAVILFLLLTPREAHISAADPAPLPQQPSESPASPRVVFAHEQLGAYHSKGPQHQPAWDVSTDPEMVALYGAGNGGVLLVRCDCGLVIRMLGHSVSADGTVCPSIWHDVPECGWHIWGTFAGWDRGAWNTAGTP